MTQLTDTEIKLLRIQFMMIAIVGFFWFLYTLTPIDSNYSVPTTAANGSTSIDSSGSFVTGLTGRMIPEGMGDLAAVSALIMIPFIPTDLLIALRFIKDIGTNWI